MRDAIGTVADPGSTASGQLRCISTVLAAAAMLLLSACGLRLPDPTPYVAGCAISEVAAPPAGEARFFFLSSALPDCRNATLELAAFRHPTLTHGTGLYSWKNPRKPSVAAPRKVMPPVLAQHARAQWLAAIDEKLATPEAQGRLLVFIHGYNTTFDEAHEMAARIGALAGEEIPLVLLHWPSRAHPLSYAIDEATVSWAQGPLDEALAELSARADDITVVAHSMGARTAIRSVLSLDIFRRARPDRVRRIVLASADEDRDRVLRPGGSVDLMLRHKRQILIYSSYRDTPLDLSRRAHGYARLGSTDCQHDILYEKRILGKRGNCHRTAPREGLAPVSTSRIDPADHYDHSDFIEDCRTRADFRAFLRGEPPPPFRINISEGDLVGYEIAPDGLDPDGLCSDNTNPD
jgi:esterase/lipase superfamily enzyme